MRISDWSSDVCSSDLRHATREATRADEAHEVPLHQCHARAFHRDVRAGAHGDPDVCAGECGCVINTVASHGDDPAFLLQAADRYILVLRENVGAHLLNAQAPGHSPPRTSAAPRFEKKVVSKCK